LNLLKNKMDKNDQKTADAFANSWNNLPFGSVYSKDQFEDWLRPIECNQVEDKTILELGCGNASLMVHMVNWLPSYLEGVDLGDSVETAIKNMKATKFQNWRIVKGDIVAYTSPGFDLVYCIGVLHHLQDSEKGFDSVVRNTKSGGQFHCWVYAEEGNWVIINIVDRIRKIASRLPWWVTKYFIATPLVAPFYLYAKLLAFLPTNLWLNKLPLYSYSRWIAERDFLFFRHVAFDQLVTPHTIYFNRGTIEKWLIEHGDEIKPGSDYIIFRNGNSWKFGGIKK
jgi:SAM-dependent methyltransferase